MYWWWGWYRLQSDWLFCSKFRRRRENCKKTIPLSDSYHHFFQKKKKKKNELATRLLMIPGCTAQPLVAAGEAMAVALLWTLLAVSRTLLSDAELSQLTVKAANKTLPPCTPTIAGCCTLLPPQSRWTVCVMGSSSTLLTWLHHNTLDGWNESKRFPQLINKTLFPLAIATHLYSASCKEFYIYTVHFYIIINVGIFTSTKIIWDTLTRHFDKDSGLEFWMDYRQLGVCVSKWYIWECEGMPFRLGLLSLRFQFWTPM